MTAVLGSDLTLAPRSDGTLRASKDGMEAVVSVRQAFPWSEPGRFLSLRDDDEKEFALIRQVGDLAPPSRGALEQALVIAGFVLEVIRIHALEEEVEVRNWKVETRQGPRTFQTRLDEWPRQLPQGGLLVKDVAGDLYHVADPAGLDHRSRSLLWAFID